MLRDVTNTALRYGTFWPGALAQDTYTMYKRRRRTQSGRPSKRGRMSYSRSYRPRLMGRRARSARLKFGSRGTKTKFSRWNKNKRSIPNDRVRPFRFFRYPIAVAAKPGAALEVQCLTDIPVASRSLNNILIKSFDIDLRFMPVAGCVQPTWVRFALVVQTGPYVLPNALELIAGTSHTDNYIDMSSTNAGWQNRSYALNSQYKVIFAKTIMMAPLLEAGATSVQSNLNAQCAIKQRVKYNKYIQFDTIGDNVPDANNVFYMYWFDDDFRLATVASTTTHRALGDVVTRYRNTEF